MTVAKIERAEKCDLKEIYRLEQRCFDAEAFSRRQLRYLLQSENAEFLLTRHQHEISSFMILLKKKNSHGLRLYSLAVSPAHRGKGLARLLLNEAAELAKSFGCRFVNLEVSENNTAAVRLYLAEGYEVVAERRAYYKDGSKALIMRKSVG